jgi:hypothetical protein
MRRFLVTLILALFGAVVGFLLPLIALVTMAIVLEWYHGDPAAGGVLSFLMIPFGPIGILAGVVVGITQANSLFAGPVPEKHRPVFDPGRRQFLTGSSKPPSNSRSED